MQRSFFIVTALAAALQAGPVAAQGRATLSTLVPGDTLRVWAVGPRLNGAPGILSHFLRDTLTLADVNAVAGQPSVQAIVPYASLRRVDVRRGTRRSPQKILLGVVAGAAAGGLIGGILGPIIECSGSCNDDYDYAGIGGFLVGSSAGIVLGGVTGGLVGARYRSPRWEAVRLTR
ncbi:MAG TPA: hypothetical protein VFO55_04720 [Gemmatimonadaceae bacterium]|nr:hypothetical protein [Gemmatimonadaceae bacterium]